MGLGFCFGGDEREGAEVRLVQGGELWEFLKERTIFTGEPTSPREHNLSGGKRGFFVISTRTNLLKVPLP